MSIGCGGGGGLFYASEGAASGVRTGPEPDQGGNLVFVQKKSSRCGAGQGAQVMTFARFRSCWAMPM